MNNYEASQAHYYRGVGLLEAEKAKEAVEAFRDSWALDEHAAAAFRLAHCLELLRDEAAGEWFAKAYEANPNNSNGAIRYAEWMSKRGEVEQARAIAQRIINRHTDYGPAKRLLEQLDS